MIFATVGTQGQFDRLIRAVDEWAGAHRNADVFAQTGPSDYPSKHIRSEKFIGPAEFRKCVETASLVISHAGMGSIITALELGKRIIIMPRRASLGEHRNDHQLATAKWLAQKGGVTVAFTEQELIDNLNQHQDFGDTLRIKTEVSSNLISTIQNFIETGQVCLPPNSKSSPE